MESRGDGVSLTHTEDRFHVKNGKDCSFSSHSVFHNPSSSFDFSTSFLRSIKGKEDGRGEKMYQKKSIRLVCVTDAVV